MLRSADIYTDLSTRADGMVTTECVVVGSGAGRVTHNIMVPLSVMVVSSILEYFDWGTRCFTVDKRCHIYLLHS